MEPTVRVLTEADYDAFFAMLSAAFGENVSPEVVRRERAILEPGRSLGAFEGDRMLAGVAAVSLQLTVPGGGSLPCAGVTSVATSPVARRRGLARRLLVRQIHDVHERGEPMAYLWASEAVIYQPFGYGAGAMAAAIDVDSKRAALLHDRRPDGHLRLLERPEALKVFPDVYERVRAERPGAVTRPAPWWDHSVSHLEEHAGTDKRTFFVLSEPAEGPEGYVMYTIEERWSHRGGPEHVLDVEELVAITDDAYLGLWRHCLEADLVRRVTGWKRPADEPLLHMLTEPRALALQIRDGTWLRLVDLRAALEGRGFATEDRVVLRVRDELAPWNDGAWEVDAGPGGASCRPSDREPDLAMDAAALASAYLGATTFRVLRGAGRVRERAAGAVDRADAMFATAVAPWCPWIF